ncbi:hypothetical protein ACQVTS_28770 [Bacillus mycoides]|uniref:hypothetical protein n=1 Tax=Bacillus mycoides TaxID=1405 RepID=UPI003D655929
MNEENIILRGATVKSSLIGSIPPTYSPIHFTNRSNRSNRSNGIDSGSGPLLHIENFLG